MFEELEEMGVRVQEEDKYEKWFTCYDFEVYQWDFREGIDHVEELDLSIRYICQCRLLWGAIWKG